MNDLNSYRKSLQQLSQFWYDDKTVDSFVKGIINSTEADGKIALISCPTLYNKLKKEADGRQGLNDSPLIKRLYKNVFNSFFLVSLFEYDQRFAVFGTDFIIYDYKSPLEIPRDLANKFDVVVADPPFLSEECLTKTAVTMKFLAKNKIVLCTGKKRYKKKHRRLYCSLIDNYYSYSRSDND